MPRWATLTGYKIFKHIEKIVSEGIAAGELSIQGAGPDKLRNKTLLSLVKGDPGEPVAPGELESLIDNSDAWSEVIRSIMESESDARQPFLEGLRSLRGIGVASVRLGDLVAVLKKRAEGPLHPGAASELARDGAGVIRTIQPDARYEQDEFRANRIDRIRQKMRSLPHGPRVQERMRKVFERLIVLDQTASQPVWEDVYTTEGISKSTFWEYIRELRLIVKEIEDES